MKYRFKSEVKALDFWKLSMYKTYHAIAGVCNIVFTAAMFGLLFHFWDSGKDIWIGLILFGCVLFPVIQPLCIYLRCVRQVEDIPKDLELEFDEVGICRGNRRKDSLEKSQPRGETTGYAGSIYGQESWLYPYGAYP